jgi:AraC-like DNA-binding protein
MAEVLQNLLYSCVTERDRSGEQFVPEHALVCIMQGEMIVTVNSVTTTNKPGTIALVRRNQLVKAVKVPPANGGTFLSISIALKQEMLRRYSAEHNVTAEGAYRGEPNVPIVNDKYIQGYFESLKPYFENKTALSKELAALKTNEAVALLLQHDAKLKNFLFDFSEPHKIDLEAFMNRNYMYNVPAEKFAKMTGRSLAAFKRDFEKTFNESPGKWLQHKRLAEAHYLIKEKGRKPSDVYLDVGFENLSHFSYAFKKAYGFSPSMVN